MYKKIEGKLWKTLIAVLIAMIFSGISTVSAKQTETVVDTSEAENGIIIINDYSENTKIDKVRVVKDSVIYTYDYENSMRIPMQSGNGVYQVFLYSHVEGNKYKQVAQENVKYKDDDGISVYLQSNHMVNWNSDMKAIKKAAKLTKSAESDADKVAAIYKFIVKNYKYDNKKARKVESGYVPEVDDIYTSKKGICYDYSVLFAAMLRSVDVPARVVMGTSKDVKGYHAWNQVYLNDKWITIDTTIDAGLGTEGTKSMEKKANRYTMEKQY